MSTCLFGCVKVLFARMNRFGLPARRQPIFAMEMLEARTYLSSPGEAIVVLAENDDFSVTFTQIALPGAIVTGAAANGTVKVTLTNTGDTAMTGAYRADLRVFARPVDGDGDDVLVGQSLNVKPGALASGAGKSFTIKVNIPTDLAPGDYVLVVVGNPTGVDENVSTAVSDPAFTVADPFVDLFVQIGAKLKLPAATVSGDGTKIAVPIVVGNNGNVAIGANTQVRATVIAREVGADEGTVVADVALNVSGIKAWGTKAYTINLTLPPGLAGGNYVFDVLVDSENDLAESNEQNNGAVTPEDVAVAVTRGFVDVEPSLLSSALPAAVVAGANQGGKVVVNVTNAGTVALPNGQRVNVTIALRPVSADDDSQDVMIGGALNQVVSKLKAGGVKKVTVNVVVGEDVAEGDYVVVIKVAPTDDLTEESVENNVLATDRAVNVADPFVDLAGAVSARLKLPSATVSGDGTKLTLPVEIRNMGNVRIPPGQLVSVTILGRRLDNGEILALDVTELAQINNVNVGGIAPGAMKLFNFAFTLPPGLEGGDYVFQAFIDSQDQVAESNEENNLAESPQNMALAVARGFLDLQMSFVGSTLAQALVAGAGGTAKVTAKVKNLGNLKIASGVNVPVNVFLRPIDAGDDSQDVTIGAATLALSNLKPDGEKNATVNVNVPPGIDPGQYFLVIRTPVLDAGEEDLANNVVVVNDAMITIADAFVDLILSTAMTTFGANALGAATGTGTVRIANQGNVAATGTVDVAFVAIPQGGGAEVPLGQRNNIAVNIPANGQTANITVPLELPFVEDSTAYNIEARIVASNLNLPNPAGNDTLAVTALNVNPAPPTASALFGAVTFTENTITDLTTNIPGVGRVGQVTSTGTFVSSNGRTGGYFYTTTYGPGQMKTAVMRLLYNGQPALDAQVITLTFTGTRPDSVHGRTLTFLNSKGGSSGSFVTNETVLYKTAFIDLNGWFHLT